MVRLKASFIDIDMTGCDRFQFLYGTIKSWKWTRETNNINGFQFLYGTIKSMIKEFVMYWAYLFQFLYGTIKRKFWKEKGGVLSEDTVSLSV